MEIFCDSCEKSSVSLRMHILEPIMISPERSHMPVHFDGFTVDESRRQLLRGVEPIHLSPKAFQLLSILIQERPEAISKSDLQKQLWPDTFVTEGNLAGLITELRTALGDDARDPRFIRTVYGFGYSF